MQAGQKKFSLLDKIRTLQASQRQEDLRAEQSAALKEKQELEKRTNSCIKKTKDALSQNAGIDKLEQKVIEAVENRQSKCEIFIDCQYISEFDYNWNWDDIVKKVTQDYLEEVKNTDLFKELQMEVKITSYNSMDVEMHSLYICINWDVEPSLSNDTTSLSRGL